MRFLLAVCLAAASGVAFAYQGLDEVSAPVQVVTLGHGIIQVPPGPPGLVFEKQTPVDYPTLNQCAQLRWPARSMCFSLKAEAVDSIKITRGQDGTCRVVERTVRRFRPDRLHADEPRGMLKPDVRVSDWFVRCPTQA